MKTTLIFLFAGFCFAAEAPKPKDEKVDPAIGEKAYRLMGRAQAAARVAADAQKASDEAVAVAKASCSAKNADLVEQEDGLHCVGKPEAVKSEPAKK